VNNSFEKPFKVLDDTFERTPDENIRISFVLSKESYQDWCNLVNPLDDGGQLNRAIELLLESCRKDM